MPAAISKVDHYSAAIPNRVGEGARVLNALRDAGVNRRPSGLLDPLESGAGSLKRWPHKRGQEPFSQLG